MVTAITRCVMAPGEIPGLPFSSVKLPGGSPILPGVAFQSLVHAELLFALSLLWSLLSPAFQSSGPHTALSLPSLLSPGAPLHSQPFRWDQRLLATILRWAGLGMLSLYRHSVFRQITVLSRAGAVPCSLIRVGIIHHIPTKAWAVGTRYHVTGFS